MTLTEKQALALAILRDHGDWMGLDAIANAMGTTRRSAGIVLGALERADLVIRWEPVYRHLPRFTAIG